MNKNKHSSIFFPLREILTAPFVFSVVRFRLADVFYIGFRN